MESTGFLVCHTLFVPILLTFYSKRSHLLYRLPLSAGLGKQRRPCQETTCHPWRRGERWRAALCFEGPSFPPAPDPRSQLPPAVTSPPPTSLPAFVGPHETCHPPNPCGQFQQRPSRTQPEVRTAHLCAYLHRISMKEVDGCSFWFCIEIINRVCV